MNQLALTSEYPNIPVIITTGVKKCYIKVHVFTVSSKGYNGNWQNSLKTCINGKALAFHCQFSLKCSCNKQIPFQVWNQPERHFFHLSGKRWKTPQGPLSLPFLGRLIQSISHFLHNLKLLSLDHWPLDTFCLNRSGSELLSYHLLPYLVRLLAWCGPGSSWSLF